ncbi:glycosyltransferase [Marivirga harenae]|uniref:glycosyltransferase n=1 Tax=Marivirga harenae TaxID=2010992 RepID=UPI0026E0D9C4|nr:glycosyltransferase [Marivirga harenae]WKV13432.1 glycosyltransferase [Marivirga harenae]
MSKIILYLGYWNLDDPLTHSTIFPNLKILKKLKGVEELHFVNTQREKPSNLSQLSLQELRVNYKPIFSKNIKPNLLNKIYDFNYFPKQIIKYSKENNINLIIARGAPAGVLALKASKVLEIPFIVESYEPHAEYMKFSGTWKSYDPRYVFQKKWEKQVKLKAQNILTVSQNYKRQLEKEGVNPKKIEVVPCVVELSKFYPDSDIKMEMRKELNIPTDATVGVYAGKFGNLYHDKEAFKLFEEASNQLDNFHLLLLSNEKDSFINKRLKEFNIPKKKLIKKFVKHSEMPQFLNIADFAFATIKSMEVSRFQSPVKIGEYWACGLPILLSQGIGDESDFIEKEKGGILIEKYTQLNLQNVIKRLKHLLDLPLDSSHYSAIAKKYRNFSQVESIYNKVLLE